MKTLFTLWQRPEIMHCPHSLQELKDSLEEKMQGLEGGGQHFE
jgi:hypothetical protein